MRRTTSWRAVAPVVAVWLGFTATVLAFIERPLPLKDVLSQSDHVFLAKVERVDAMKPATVLLVERDYKGKAPYRRLAINLTGDKEKHTPQLLRRIAPELPVVAF